MAIWNPSGGWRGEQEVEVRSSKGGEYPSYLSVSLLCHFRQEFVVTDDGVCSQVPESGKDLKMPIEETASLGAAKESLRSHLKQGVLPEEWTVKGSRSSPQRPWGQSEGKQKPLPSPKVWGTVISWKYRSELKLAPGFQIKCLWDTSKNQVFKL